MLREVQRVYRLQGVEISDKHIEVIVRQMLKKIRIENNGDTEFLPGTMVDVLDLKMTNESNDRRRERTGRRKTGYAWYYQGIPGYQFLPVSGFLPGDHQGSDRSCHQG